MREKNSKLLLQLGISIVILFSITICINALVVYRGSSSRYKARQMKKVESWVEMVEENLNRDDHSWDYDYWRKNYASMELEAQQFDYAEQEIIRDICQRNGVDYFNELSERALNNLTEEEQQLLSQVRYWSFDSFFSTYFLRRDLETDKVRIIVFLLEEGDKGFVLSASGSKDLSVSEDSYDNSYVLGDSIIFELEGHPAAKRLYENGEMQKEMETTYVPGGLATLDYYAPLKAKGKTVGLIRVSIDWTENMINMLNSSANVQKTNFIVLLTVAAVILILVYFLVIRPVKFIQKALRKYMVNKDANDIAKNMDTIHLSNELGILAKDVSNLAAEMDRHTKEVSRLSVEKERKNTELNIARDIQMQNIPSSFPAFPDRKDFDIYASMEPAWEVGGDFYDFFLIDDDHLALIIADVSGKGVPAALFMMMAKTQVKTAALSEHQLRPAKILKRVNDELTRGNESAMFVTLWLGIFTISDGRLVTVNAGHEDPFISRDGEGFEIAEEEHGLALGLLEDQEYTENYWELKENDAIFVYTDGLPEAMNSDGETFGMSRLEVRM